MKWNGIGSNDDHDALYISYSICFCGGGKNKVLFQGLLCDNDDAVGCLLLTSSCLLLSFVLRFITAATVARVELSCLFIELR